MFKMKSAVIFALIVIVLTAAGCTKRAGRITEDITLIPVDDFPYEIARLNEITKESGSPSERARAHIQLAILYSHYRNPSPNFSLALAELNSYIASAPDEGNRPEIHNLLSLLKRIEALTKENQDLTKENQKMKEAIKNLKVLDVEMEKKRKQY